jgi:AraC family transcriptional regulator, transcriptional activator of pobA
MDGPAPGWYFSTMSTMRRGPRSARWTPQVVEFHRTKYGRELLLDAAFVRAMPTFLSVAGPHVLRFHDILLVTRGRGTFRLDDEDCRVAPGVMLFTRPGELRAWDVSGLDGACLFFAEEFVAEAFADVRFLDRLAFFHDGRPSAALALAPDERKAFLSRFHSMQREIQALRDDASHALRAVLYDLLVLINRWYAKRHGSASSAPVNGVVERFRELVEREHTRWHRVSDYAAELGVSPGHLNALCRATLRCSASRVVRQRLTLEAKRLLAFSDMTAAEVGFRLGFEDPAYFARFFRREAGQPPTAFRARSTARAAPYA